MCTALLDWARPNNVGFSSVVSLGGSADIDFGEIVDYLMYDPRTEHILLYVEGVRDARRFVGALRAAARAKPVIVIKAGRHPTGVRAAVSHTGALVGADDVFDAALRRTGAVRVTTIGQLVAAAQALSSRVRPRGERLAVVTNGGGPGVLAADRATDLTLPLAELSPATIDVLKRALPSNWSHGNPIDLIGDADSARYAAAVGACLEDPGVDGVLVILTPQAMTSPTDVARAVAACAKRSDKPLLAAWMGEAQVVEGRGVFQAQGIPVFRTPEPAVEMFAHVSSFYRNQRMLMQTPGPLCEQEPPDLARAKAIIDASLEPGITVLSSADSRALLAAFRIPVVRTVRARSVQEAVSAAEAARFPRRPEIDSPDITHKTDVGGVVLNLLDAQAVSAAYGNMLETVRRSRTGSTDRWRYCRAMLKRENGRELMIGVVTDPVFGPADHVRRRRHGGGSSRRSRRGACRRSTVFWCPEMIRSTRVHKLLGPFRGMPPADMRAIEHVLLRISEMVWRTCRAYARSTSIHCLPTNQARSLSMRASLLHPDRRPRVLTTTWRSIPIPRIWPLNGAPPTERRWSFGRFVRKTRRASANSSRALAAVEVSALHGCGKRSHAGDARTASPRSITTARWR
jgi:acetyltransferase